MLVPRLDTRFAYRLVLQAAIMAHTTRLADTQQQTPPLRPFRWAAWQAWFTRVRQTSDIHYVLASLLFLGQPPSLPVMLGPTLFAVMRLAAYLQRTLAPRVPSVARPCSAILARKVRCREQACTSVGLPCLTRLARLLWHHRLLPPPRCVTRTCARLLAESPSATQHASPRLICKAIKLDASARRPTSSG